MEFSAFPTSAADGPRPLRKNLLLSGSIEAEGLKVAVRIRNLSETGAMLDGAALPVAGTRVILRRAEIEVSARVMWQTAGRCGIAFEQSAITVDEWVSGKRVVGFDSQRGQARVDAIQSAVRTGAPLPAESGSQGAAPTSAELDKRIVEEILLVRRLLDRLGEELVEDPAVVREHVEALQNLDRASQMLEHLGAILGAEDRLAAAQSIAMQDLRARLLHDG